MMVSIWRPKVTFLLAVVSVFVIAGFSSRTGAAKEQYAATPERTQVENLKNPPQRFDYLVRKDFFAGLKGDQDAFNRAMKVCQDALAKDPEHAEAMVWYGSGIFYLAGQAFQDGDFKTGGELWDRGLKTMDDAVALAPANVGVLIPRGATLIAASRNVPVPGQARMLLEKGIADYERVLGLQGPYFDRLSVHARGELLIGLAAGWHRLGDLERTRQYLQRVMQECEGSRYEEEARAWLENQKNSVSSCLGCHSN